MKKAVLSAFMLVLLSTAMVVIFIKPVAASFPVHNIDTGLDYATIQEAVEAPETLDGHRIVVDPGTYHENLITVAKRLAIIANSTESEVIIMAKQGSGFSIGVNNVTIQGFTLKNITGTGIGAGGIEHSNIIDNTIIGNSTSYSHGIELGNSPYSNLIGNTVVSFETGIELRDSNNCTLVGNKAISNEWMGIRILGSHDCTMIGNEAKLNKKYGGIVIMSYWNTVKDNKATSNEGYGILIRDSISNNVYNNTVSNNKDGLGILDSYECKLNGNNVTSNRDYGIRLVNAEGAVLTNNIMTNNSFNFGVIDFANPDFSYNLDIDASNVINGKKVYYLVNQSDLEISPSTFPDLGFLALVNSRNILVKDLTLKNNSVGLLFAYTNNSIIEGVNILSNEFGVKLHGCINVTVKDSNVASNDKAGIQLTRSKECTIINNTVSSNGANTVSDHNLEFSGDYGIGLEPYSENCTIAKNNILNNHAGIHLGWRHNNFFSNNFINNSIQLEPQFLPVPNRWDYNYEGNYWSDYQGVDKNNDGIGDNILPHEHVDYYPLMGPYKEFDITRENKVYPVDVISNSSINNLRFNQSEKSLSFTISVKTDTIGFSRVTIPHALLSGPYTVTIDNSPPLFATEESNGTHTKLYFTYPSGTHQAKIVGTIVPLVDTTPPVAEAGPNKKVAAGTVLNFDASGSSDNVGITTYEWNFGDGATGSGLTTTHIYSEPGTYTVILTVRDAAGNSNTDSITVTVEAASPVTLPWWVIPTIIIAAFMAGIATSVIIFRRKKRKGVNLQCSILREG